MAKFIKGQAIKFKRNDIIKQDSTIVSCVLDKNNPQQQIQLYVVEYVNGWNPDDFRSNKYALDVNKKYIFVSENELTAI